MSIPLRPPAKLQSQCPNLTGSMLGILYTFCGMGFLIFMKKRSFFLLRVMWAKLKPQIPRVAAETRAELKISEPRILLGFSYLEVLGFRV